MLLHAIAHALATSFAMGWEILWPLILGFFFSGSIQAVVSHKQMSILLPDDKPKTLVKASLLGAASSSCSYAAVALGRSIFRKGGNFTSAMAFEMASTNLVIELGVIMLLLLGWQFTAAEFIGGPKDYGSAVLIRAVEPLSEIDIIRRNRSNIANDIMLTNGPAKLCQALNLDLKLNGHDLSRKTFRLVLKPEIPSSNIGRSSRVGIKHGLDKKWRLYIKNNPYVSR